MICAVRIIHQKEDHRLNYITYLEESSAQAALWRVLIATAHWGAVLHIEAEVMPEEFVTLSMTKQVNRWASGEVEEYLNEAR